MSTVLFICSGNIFRSVVAEHALRAALPPDVSLIAASAGIEAMPQPVPPYLIACLKARGADLSAHVPRRLTRDLLAGCHTPIAMGLNHQDFIRREFGLDVPLFNRLCFDRDDPVLDVHEALPNWQSDPEGMRRYVDSVIEHIWTAAPRLVQRLP